MSITLIQNSLDTDLLTVWVDQIAKSLFGKKILYKFHIALHLLLVLLFIQRCTFIIQHIAASIAYNKRIDSKHLAI